MPKAEPPSAAAEEAAEDATAAVYVGLWVSAVRCLLTYVVAPVIGTLGLLLGPAGLLLQILGAITASSGAWRLWRSRHRRWLPYALVAVTVDLLTVITIIQLAVGFRR